MAIGIVLAWIALALAVVLSLASVKTFAWSSPLRVLILLGAAVYLTYITYQWIADSRFRFEVELDGDLLTFRSYDQWQRKSEEQHIFLPEVLAAEYFQPQDEANLRLRTSKGNINIPLWSFGPEAETKIAHYIRSRGVDVIGIAQP
ncbi:MAG TPA: hypothetical protein V6D22_00290 [Candidatus Obscuribacterales bacterium]